MEPFVPDRRDSGAHRHLGLQPSDLPVFAYGTLVDEGFVASLLEHPVESVAARLLDFELLELPGLGYPTVFAAEGETVEGRLYRHLGPVDLERIDAYEGVGEGLYRRVTAEVEAEDRDLREPAFLYVVAERTIRRLVRAD